MHDTRPNACLESLLHRHGKNLRLLRGSQHHLADETLRLLRYQRFHRVRDVIRLQHLAQIFSGVRRKFRIHAARANHADANSVRPQILGHALRQPQHAPFRRAINPAAGKRAFSRNRRDIDNVPARASRSFPAPPLCSPGTRFSSWCLILRPIFLRRLHAWAQNSRSRHCSPESVLVPSAATVFSISCATSPLRETSAATAITCRLQRARFPLSPRPACRASRAQMHTSAPSEANRFATARPMPRLAPVTSATCSASVGEDTD